MAMGDELGITSALGRAILYDTIIQHGGGDGADSLSAIAIRTMDQRQGTPKNGIDEQAWLKAFLAERRHDLLHPADETTKDVWAVSVGRVDVFSDLLNKGNTDLHGPISLDTDSYTATIH